MARNMKYVATTTPGLPVEEVSISGLPSGSSTPAANSITTAMLQDGAVTKGKIAAGVIPEAYTLPAATTGALGGVPAGRACGERRGRQRDQGRVRGPAGRA